MGHSEGVNATSADHVGVGATESEASWAGNLAAGRPEQTQNSPDQCLSVKGVGAKRVAIAATSAFQRKTMRSPDADRDTHPLKA